MIPWLTFRGRSNICVSTVTFSTVGKYLDLLIRLLAKNVPNAGMADCSPRWELISENLIA